MVPKPGQTPTRHSPSRPNISQTPPPRPAYMVDGMWAVTKPAMRTLLSPSRGTFVWENANVLTGRDVRNGRTFLRFLSMVTGLRVLFKPATISNNRCGDVETTGSEGYGDGHGGSSSPSISCLHIQTSFVETRANGRSRLE